jgi:hypothetical protein
VSDKENKWHYLKTSSFDSGYIGVTAREPRPFSNEAAQSKVSDLAENCPIL